MDNQQAKSLFNLGWLIGMIEGEGWIILAKQLLPSKNYRYVPVIGMNTTSSTLKDKFVEIVKENDIGVWVGYRESQNRKWKNQHQINIRGFKRCLKLLNLIIPYLEYKKPQAELVKEYIEYRFKVHTENTSRKFIPPTGEKDESFRTRLMQMNEKGKSFNDYTPNTKM